MTSRTHNLTYSRALSGGTDRVHPPKPSKSPNKGKANFVFTVEDDSIRENIRYRIYDFCFDVVYDKTRKPTIMQYVRNLDLPLHPLLKRKQWENAMVHRHWSHKPRGLTLLCVSPTINREVFFRFYWFHFPNWVLPRGDLHDLQRRLRKIPEPHSRNANAQVSFHRTGPSKKGTQVTGAVSGRYNEITDLISHMDLDQRHAPWRDHTNLDGMKEKVIIGNGFQIIAQLDKGNRAESLCFSGKLGNLIFRPSPEGILGNMDFEASGCTRSRRDFPTLRGAVTEEKGIPEVFRHFHPHFESPFRVFLQTTVQLPAAPITSSGISQGHVGQLEAHGSYKRPVNSAGRRPASECGPPKNPIMALQNTSHVSEPADHHVPRRPPEYEEDLSYRQPQNCKRRLGNHNSIGHLRGGDLHVVLHELNYYTFDVITSIENRDMLQMRSSGDYSDFLRQKELRYPAQSFEPIFTEEVSEALRAESELEILNMYRLQPEPENGEQCGSTATCEQNRKEVQLSGRKLFRDLADMDCLPSEQTPRPLQPKESFLPHRISAELNLGNSTCGEPVALHLRETSLEYRIAQWIKRGGDPMSSRKSSWSDGKEACELSSRKRVTSSNYHSCFSQHSSSDKHFSPITVAYPIMAPSSRSSSAKCASSTAANPSAGPAAVSPPPEHQGASPKPLQASSPSSTANRTAASVLNRAHAPSEITNTHMTRATHYVATAATTSAAPNSRTSSRRVSASSNIASLCVGDRCENDEPIIVPGAKQFLTPKRDVKPWWEAAAGDRGCQSTGGKKKRGVTGRRKEREARGSTNSWISLE